MTKTFPKSASSPRKGVGCMFESLEHSDFEFVSDFPHRRIRYGGRISKFGFGGRRLLLLQQKVQIFVGLTAKIQRFLVVIACPVEIRRCR